MSKYIINAKNEEYTGESHGVVFFNGQGQTENDWAAEMLRESGYTVEEIEEEKEDPAAAEAAAAAAAAEAEAAAKAAAEAEAKAAAKKK